MGIERITQTAKSAIKSLGHRFGLELRVSGPRSRPELRLVKFLNHHGIDLIIDVGANRGQFSKEIFQAGYLGEIVSFEPLPNAHAQLIEAARPFNGRWKIAPRMALSDRAGLAEMQITKSDTSSSLLEPTRKFVETVPRVEVVDRTSVPTERLDVAIKDYLSAAKKIFLKIDVQGFEKQVLDGSKETISIMDGAIVEVCTDRLYSGQSDIAEILEMFSSEKFDLWDINTVFRAPDTLRMAAVDMVYFRAPGRE
jgi:FkbM family methyltransferase